MAEGWDGSFGGLPVDHGRDDLDRWLRTIMPYATVIRYASDTITVDDMWGNRTLVNGGNRQLSVTLAFPSDRRDAVHGATQGLASRGYALHEGGTVGGYRGDYLEEMQISLYREAVPRWEELHGKLADFPVGQPNAHRETLERQKQYETEALF